MVAFSDVLQRCACRQPRPRRLLKRICPASVVDDDDDDGDESPEEYTAAVDAEFAEWRQEWALQAHFSAVTTRFKHAGYVILHLAWGFFAWIIFAYGRLVYNTLGPSAARDFSNSWGIGVALGQVNDASGVVTAALQAVAVATVLEMLWLVNNTNWLETYMDVASVVGSVAVGAGGRRLRDVLLTNKRHTFGIA